nr:hypothetical protein BgiMline_007081 [Biomphalaria glabrata]
MYKNVYYIDTRINYNKYDCEGSLHTSIAQRRPAHRPASEVFYERLTKLYRGSYRVVILKCWAQREHIFFLATLLSKFGRIKKVENEGCN